MECEFYNKMDELKTYIDKLEGETLDRICEINSVNSAEMCRVDDLECKTRPENIIGSIAQELETLNEYRKIVSTPGILQQILAAKEEEIKDLKQGRVNLAQDLSETIERKREYQKLYEDTLRSTVSFTELFEFLYSVISSFSENYGFNDRSKLPVAKEFYVSAVIDIINTLKSKEIELNGRT